jgi:6-phosphogluconolactonase (cycloisomerase 2 family)
VLTPITGSPFTAGENPSSAAVDASGRFLYVVNAANSADGNSISGFSIDTITGALTSLSGSPFPAAVSPVSVTTEPGAQFAYVGLDGNQGIRAFAIDQHTGTLTEISGSPFPAPGSTVTFASTY